MSLKVPADWRIAEIGEVGKVRAGTTPSRTGGARFYATHGHAWVKTLDLNDGEIFDTDEHITDAALKETSCVLNPPGTVLVAMYGGFNQIGRSGVLRIPAATNQAVAGIQLDTDNCDPLFLNYCLVFLRPEWRRVAASSRKDPNITKRDLLDFHIPLPSIHEQRRIAETLFSIDEAIRAGQSIIEQTRKVKEGVLKRLLTNGVGHTEFKQTEIGEIPKEWEVVPLSEVSLRTTYGFTNPMPTTESGPWMITAANVKDSKIDYSSARRTDEIAYRELLTDKSRPEKGVVLITKDGTLGRVAIVDRDDICINQSVASLTPDLSKTTSDFLALTLQSPQMQERILSESGGTSVKHIYITKLAKTLMPLPPVEEQAKIVNRSIACQDYLDRQVEHLFRLETVKSGLMSDLLTGRRRVTMDLPMAAE